MVMGSVYKLSGNRRKPWIARKTIGWDNEGKQEYYTIGYYETRAKALEALADYNKKPLGEKGDITLEKLYEKWSVRKYAKVSFKTKESYTVAWKHLSVLGKEKFKDIKTSHLQEVIDDMEEKGLSKSSCHKVKVLASLLYKYALADDIVDKNYASLVELPEDDSKTPEPFNDLEIKMLSNLAAKDIWIGTILILIYTGMRIGELLKLTKADVNIENMLIVGGIKTPAGKDRIIPINPKIQKYVLYWFNTEGQHLINRDGKKIRINYYRTYLYYPSLEKAKVRRLTPHSTRHTFGSLLNRSGVNKVYIQKLIGHADYSTTANIYTHPEIAELKNAIGMI